MCYKNIRISVFEVIIYKTIDELTCFLEVVFVNGIGGKIQL